MAVSTMWIRNNMLSSPCEQYERQLTEAELKVQRSLQKLSIPDWYLNKRSNPPKILNNVTPIEIRPPSWKSYKFRKDSTSPNLSVSDVPPPTVKTTTETARNQKKDSKVSKVKSAETKQKKTSSKSWPLEEEAFDTTIPEIKLPTNISRTFPKMSPSRKIQNINIVFPPGPPINISDETRNKLNAKDAKSKIETNAEQKNDTSKMDEAIQQTPTRKNRHESFELPVVQWNTTPTSPINTPNMKGSFKVRVASTPKFTPANLFSSTVIEDFLPAKKGVSRNILEKSFIFEGSSRLSDSFAEKSFGSATRSKKLSQSLLEKTSFFENNSKFEELSDSRLDISKKLVNRRLSLFLERNIHSIDPILFEKDDKAVLACPKSSSMVREMVNKLEISADQIHTCQKELQSKSKDRDFSRVQMSNLGKKNAAAVLEEKMKVETQSPCTRFLYSRRKSIDLENVVRSKQSASRENTIVRGIIETLTQRSTKSSLSSVPNMGINQNLVKKLIDTLEKGEVQDAETTRKEEDIESCSEAEDKSSATTTSLKDTDSSSDSDQRLTELRSDVENQTTDFEVSVIKKMSEDELKIPQDDDSVYWIPVSRCKLPRTSSLLSIMSRLSGNGQSPCVSPIRSDSEGDNSRTVIWGATFKKSNHALSRRLFRIDETTVIDSGYSDRSDKSGTSGSVTDSTWSEDTQDVSSFEKRSSKMKKSSRRKSIVGHTFRASS
ncbi:uncharacterized protein LOC143177376 [Calliopsis andreniformis]|uniref:uncharacterized protein LOC143177376 n=1 Tax=Calliopsis andreniformis TaxID=337506 RepID=UPI003FCEA4CF